MAIRIEEKRIFPRIRLRAPLRYQILGTPEFAHAVTYDIGFRGLAFTNNKFIAPEIPVAIEIQLLTRILRARGKVAWANPLPHSDRFRLGIEFLEVGKIDQDYLKDYLEMRSGRF